MRYADSYFCEIAWKLDSGAGVPTITIWACRFLPSDVNKLAKILAIDLTMSFKGLATASKHASHTFMKFTSASPTGGTDISVRKLWGYAGQPDSEMTIVKAALFDGTSLGTTGMVFEGSPEGYRHASLPCSATGTIHRLPFTPPLPILKSGDGLVVLTSDTIVGQLLTGGLTWAEGTESELAASLYSLSP